MEELLAKIDVELNDVDFNKWRLDVWQEQIPEEISNDWNKLTDRERKLVYIMAQKLSDKYYEELDSFSRSFLT